MPTDKPAGPAYAGQPVILIHVLTAGRAACADSPVSNAGLNGNLHPSVPRVMCPGCVLTVQGMTLAQQDAVWEPDPALIESLRADPHG